MLNCVFYWSFRPIYGLISSLFYVFATHPRHLSSVQLLVIKELFHQSTSTWNILFHQSSFYLEKVILIFLLGTSPGANVRGKCYRPDWRVFDSSCIGWFYIHVCRNVQSVKVFRCDHRQQWGYVQHSRSGSKYTSSLSTLAGTLADCYLESYTILYNNYRPVFRFIWVEGALVLRTVKHVRVF